MSEVGTKCQGRNADGSSCGAPPSLVLESGFCAPHDPALVKERSEHARKGGEALARKRRTSGLPPEELGNLATVEDAQRWLVAIAQAVGERRLSASEGATMTRGVSEWMRSEDLRLRATRLRELEAKVKELQGGRGR